MPALAFRSAKLLVITVHPLYVAIAKRVLPPIDRAMYALTGGRIFSMTFFSGLLLTTTGRKTGQRRSIPLLYVEHHGLKYVIGSNFGQRSHPVWTLNLIATPEAVISVRGRRIPVKARLLDGDERALIWPVLTSAWPAFDHYTDRTGRTLRVFELTELPE
ncbi:nitroreductase family deazaflavin-dependent oxidoreductase [Nocardia xishanensis]|uniref:Nitroreductase family deazaflavin-dependent oxidoreductase n=1 Tax=Nocardia xishanensis TaxID=238964 RepID=A0ABW7WXU6_9NOCA